MSGGAIILFVLLSDCVMVRNGCHDFTRYRWAGYKCDEAKSELEEVNIIILMDVYREAHRIHAENSTGDDIDFWLLNTSKELYLIMRYRDLIVSQFSLCLVVIINNNLYKKHK